MEEEEAEEVRRIKGTSHSTFSGRTPETPLGGAVLSTLCWLYVKTSYDDNAHWFWHLSFALISATWSFMERLAACILECGHAHNFMVDWLNIQVKRNPNQFAKEQIQGSYPLLTGSHFQLFCHQRWRPLLAKQYNVGSCNFHPSVYLFSKPSSSWTLKKQRLQPCFYTVKNSFLHLATQSGVKPDVLNSKVLKSQFESTHLHRPA